MKRTLIQTLLIASGMIALNVGFAQEAATALTIPDPVATVKGKAISKAEFEKFASGLLGGNLSVLQNAEQVNNIVDAYALQKDIAAKALAEKLDATPSFKEALEEIKGTMLADAWIKKFVDGVKVSDAAIKAEYDKQFAAIDKKEYKAAHILVEKEDEAKKVLAELADKKVPLTFEDAAKKYSTDPGSKENGGDLGWFRPQMMVKEFSEAVAKLKKGEMTTAAVKSQFGYHIIKLEDERSTPIDSIDASKERIKQSLIEVQTRDKIEEIRNALKIEYKLK